MRISKAAVSLLATLAVAQALAGCDANQTQTAGKSQTDRVLEQQMAKDQGSQPTNAESTLPGNAAAAGANSPQSTPPAPPESGEGSAAESATAAPAIDVDLTQLSSTMVYSEVYNMVMTPEKYVGKTVKMSGQFAAYAGNPAATDGPAYYFAVVIADATACCQQGLEFVWPGEHAYPADYPAAGAEITVTGTFEAYQVGEGTSYHLIADHIEADS